MRVSLHRLRRKYWMQPEDKRLALSSDTSEESRTIEGTNSIEPPNAFDVRREHHPHIGLARELLRDPTHVALIDPQFQYLLNDPSAIAAIERDQIPIPAPPDREGYFKDRDLSYWLSGLDDLRVVQSLVPATALSRVLDFGGATGRFARHVALADEAATVTIAEINVSYVDWVETHFGRNVRAVKVSPFPHFPLADSSVTLCVGFSVFTHIDTYESSWLAEIHRVLADDGYAFLTIHSEHMWPLLPDQPGLTAALQTDPSFDRMFQADSPMPKERLVFNWETDSIKQCCNVFCSTDYIQRCWSRWFEIVEIRPQAHHGCQTVIVLRKNSS